MDENFEKFKKELDFSFKGSDIFEMRLKALDVKEQCSIARAKFNLLKHLLEDTIEKLKPIEDFVNTIMDMDDKDISNEYLADFEKLLTEGKEALSNTIAILNGKK